MHSKHTITESWKSVIWKAFNLSLSLRLKSATKNFAIWFITIRIQRLSSIFHESEQAEWRREAPVHKTHSFAWFFTVFLLHAEEFLRPLLCSNTFLVPVLSLELFLMVLLQLLRWCSSSSTSSWSCCCSIAYVCVLADRCHA